MRKIGLIDIDYNGSFPNIALMKLSAFHKAQGNEVGWYSPFAGRYDIVYVSKVFSWSADYLEHINAARVIRGGSGYNIVNRNGKEVWENQYGIETELPSEIEHIYPDYSLYPRLTKETSFGFLTRGCPRGCGFCHVASKEGRYSRKVANLNEFWSGQKNIVLCDPNILACPDRLDLLGQLADSKVYVDFNQGLDARMINEETARMLGKIKLKEVHFAWDCYADRQKILAGLRTYSEYAERKPHSHNAIVYVLVNFDSTIEQDLDRIYTLRDMGYWAYVMIYDKPNCRQIYRDMQRWCNNRIIFAKCEKFEDYKRNL